MLKLSNVFQNTDVLSLRTGGPIAVANKAIIDPNNLKVEGWHVTDKFDKTDLILVSTDVREIIDKGIVINDHEVLSSADDLVRLKSVLEIDFTLMGKVVATDSGKKLGKVVDFAIETSGLIIKKLYVAQPLVKNFSGGTLSIDRNQIVEITNQRIIVEEPTEKAKVQAIAPAVAAS